MRRLHINLRAAVHALPLAAVLSMTALPVRALAGGLSSGGKSSAAGTQGALELGLKGMFDFDATDATVAYVDLAVGYFVLPSFELGLTTLQGTTSTGERDSFGLFGEYDAFAGAKLMPFGGLALKHTGPPTDSATGDGGTIFSLYGGVNVMVASNVALATTLSLRAANQAVLGSPGHRKRTGRDATLGLRLFF